MPQCVTDAVDCQRRCAAAENLEQIVTIGAVNDHLRSVGAELHRVGKAKVDIQGADSMEAELPDGFVMFSEGWTHQVHNVGDKDIHAIIVEHKD